MQLIYIYIKEFRNLKDCEMTFSPCYQIQYGKEEQTLSVTKKEKEELGPKLYGDHICSVHGVVGRNASGKTNIADLISLPAKLREEASNENTASAYFLLYRKKDSSFYMELHDEERSIFPELTDPEQLMEGMHKWSERSLPEKHWYSGWITIVNQKPVWAEQKEAFSCSVVSLREHMNQQYFDIGEEGRSSEKYYDDSFSRRFIGCYDYGSLANQYDALLALRRMSHQLGKRTSGVPKKNAPSFDDAAYSLTLKVSPTVERNKKFFPGLEGEIFYQAPKRIRFLIYCLCAFVSKHVLDIPQNQQAWEMTEARISPFGGMGKIPKFQEYVEALCDPDMKFSDCIFRIKNFVSQIVTRDLALRKDEKYLRKQMEFQEFLDRFLIVMDYLVENRKQEETLSEDQPEADACILEEGKTMYIPLNMKLRKTDAQLQTFLSHSFVSDTEFLRSSWHHISDGERHLLQGYASLYETLDKAGVFSAAPPDTCMILLDEPELHSHPELARNFLLWLTEWLKKTESGKGSEVKYQIVVFTHSPFLLSDIDKEHVIHIERKKNGRIQIGQPREQTFASNIHDVLSDSIFLDHAVGAIAYKNLQALSKELSESEKSGTFSFQTYEEKKELISLIGEPILKSAFQEALYKSQWNEKER